MRLFTKLTLLMLTLSFALAHSGQFVAVLETMKEPQAKLDDAELRYLTDELRKQALRALPVSAGFTVMTRENIQAMLPPGTRIEECQGDCLVETGKNIGADFVAQGRVGKFGGQLTLTVEMYETRQNRLVGSFTGRKPNAEGLLELIEKEATGVFSKVRPADVSPRGTQEIRTGLELTQGNNDFDLEVPSLFLVAIASEPEGAAVSVDGRPSCPKTPCKLELAGGEHTFLAVQEAYEDASQQLLVAQNGQNVLLKLKPNFGTLTLSPQAAGGGSGDISLSLDGKTVKAGDYRLSPGAHQVVASHRCFEDVTAQVGLARGGHETFAPELSPKLSGLVLSAEKGGEPQSVPVWVDGKQVGETPWSGKVPWCSKVEIGANRAPVQVDLLYRQTVRHTHKLAMAPPGMVGIPAGCFDMGSNDGESDEKPVHRVCVSVFSMDKTEVTQGQYQSVMGSNPSDFSSCGDDCPVEQVDWDDANNYCQKVGKRLPTEAEWEYAARAGTDTRYYCGNSESCLKRIAWYDANSDDHTHPVGKKEANSWGLYDMAGNVWEWTGDWKGDYAAGNAQNPQAATSGSLRVFRGGGWGSEPTFLRSANRSYNAPGDHSFNLGFRCVTPE